MAGSVTRKQKESGIDAKCVTTKSRTYMVSIMLRNITIAIEPYILFIQGARMTEYCILLAPDKQWAGSVYSSFCGHTAGVANKMFLMPITNASKLQSSKLLRSRQPIVVSKSAVFHDLDCHPKLQKNFPCQYCGGHSQPPPQCARNRPCARPARRPPVAPGHEVMIPGRKLLF